MEEMSDKHIVLLKYDDIKKHGDDINDHDFVFEHLGGETFPENEQINDHDFVFKHLGGEIFPENEQVEGAFKKHLETLLIPEQEELLRSLLRKPTRQIEN